MLLNKSAASLNVCFVKTLEAACAKSLHKLHYWVVGTALVVYKGFCPSNEDRCFGPDPRNSVISSHELDSACLIC
jgi:hypothetical protein